MEKAVQRTSSSNSVMHLESKYLRILQDHRDSCRTWKWQRILKMNTKRKTRTTSARRPLHWALKMNKLTPGKFFELFWPSLTALQMHNSACLCQRQKPASRLKSSPRYRKSSRDWVGTTSLVNASYSNTSDLQKSKTRTCRMKSFLWLKTVAFSTVPSTTASSSTLSASLPKAPKKKNSCSFSRYSTSQLIPRSRVRI